MSEFIHPDLELFRRLVAFDSFSAAAGQLGVQQPALTKMVGRLEERMGQKLLLRGRQGFDLTHDGELLLERLKRVQRAWEAHVNETPQRITLAAHEAIASAYLPYLLPLLVEQFPQMEVNLAEAPSVEVSRKVAEGEWDMGLVINPLRHADLLFKQVGEEFVALWGQSAKVGEVILVHPDMLMVGRLMRHLPEARPLTVPSYETIANIAARTPWSALLPNPVAQRHQLKLQSERFFQVKLSLIARKNRFPSDFFRQVGEMAMTAAQKVSQL